jgi:hypothetical protein
LIAALAIAPASVIIAGVMTVLVFAAAVSVQPQPSTVPEMWDAWCARCHAVDGTGRVAEPTITVEPMDFTECRVATAEPDADWEVAIALGGPAVGLSAEMPAFGDSLDAETIRGFVRHMRGFCGERGWPSGNANFPRPIFTEKAFPENEFVLLPVVSHRRPDTADGAAADGVTDVAFTALFERRFGKRAMWEVALPMVSHDAVGSSRQHGVGDLELAAKYVLFTDTTQPRILSAGLEVVLPTGSSRRGLGSGTSIWEPYLSFGTLVGATYVQAQAKVEIPADSSKADRAFVYHLYAGRDWSATPDTWTLGVELNGENDELAFTPQVRKGLTKTGALGAAVGVRVPITARREQGTRVVGYLLWEYLEPVRARP